MGSHIIRFVDWHMCVSCLSNQLYDSKHVHVPNIDRLVQEWRSSIANAQEVHFSCSNPSICGWLHDLILLSKCVKECETSALYLEKAWHDIDENFMTWFVNNAGMRYQNFHLRTALCRLSSQIEKYNKAINNGTKCGISECLALCNE